MATLANAENDALVDTVVDSPADVEEKTLGERKAEAKVGTLAEKITECKSTHLATYSPWWRLTLNRDSSVQARTERSPHTWPNIRQR